VIWRPVAELWRSLTGERPRRGPGSLAPANPAGAVESNRVDAPSEGSLFADRYRLDRVLGRGSAGEVRLAIDTRTGQSIALKLFAAPPRAAQPIDEHQTRELLASRRLSHPGIAAVLDVGRSGAIAWMAMEFVSGVPLTRYTQRARLLPEALVMRLAARMADALAHAHARRVVHRDLKPANVLVDLAAMQVKLLDFGVARIDEGQATRTGMTLGTPAYMAPEQLAGHPVSPASDVYALGVILFEMLTGRRPHEGATMGELLRAVASTPPAQLARLRPDLPADLCATVQQLLASLPEQRPGDLVELARRMDALAARQETEAKPRDGVGPA
jgi:serine/threonine-protein kinase